MARQRRALVLLLSRNDHAGNDFYRPHGVCKLPELARSTRPQHLASLGADAGVPLSLSCQHFRLDDRRIRTSTMVDLRHFQTRDGYSKVVSNGDTIFTLIGFV